MQNSTLITVKVACSAFAAIAASCNQPIKYPEGGYDYPTHIAAKDTAFYYLPLRKAFSRRDSFNRATNFFPMSFFNPSGSFQENKEIFFSIFLPGGLLDFPNFNPGIWSYGIPIIYAGILFLEISNQPFYIRQMPFTSCSLLFTPLTGSCLFMSFWRVRLPLPGQGTGDFP